MNFVHDFTADGSSVYIRVAEAVNAIFSVKITSGSGQVSLESADLDAAPGTASVYSEYQSATTTSADLKIGVHMEAAHYRIALTSGSSPFIRSKLSFVDVPESSAAVSISSTTPS